MGSKLTRVLQEKLHGANDDELVDVVVEFHPTETVKSSPGMSRVDLLTAVRKQFRDIAAPVEDRIQKLGGEVIEHAWINKTLRARVPAGKVAQIEDADGVSLLDLPERITRD